VVNIIVQANIGLTRHVNFVPPRDIEYLEFVIEKGYMTDDIEKRDLEAHVVLCAERYKNLDRKLDNLEERTSHIERTVNDIKERLFTTKTQSQEQDLARVRSSSDQVLKYALGVIALLITIIIGISAYEFQRIDNATNKTATEATETK